MAATLDGLEEDFRRRLEALVAASGGKVTIRSGYRSVEEQQRLWDNAVKKYGSPEAARKWVAPPGKSNHNKGFAVDLGGDLRLAAQLAPQFGLYFPMKHEPWHIEPVGSRTADSHEAWTANPSGEPNGDAHDVGFQLATFMRALSTDTEGVDSPEMEKDNEGRADDVARISSRRTTPGTVDGDLVGRLMAALRRTESSNNYTSRAKGSSASGAYGFVKGTWANFGGYAEAWMAPREVQDAKARMDLERKLREYGGDPRKVVQSWYYPAQVGNDSYVPEGNSLSLGAYADKVLTFL